MFWLTISEYDDWGITYKEMAFKSKLPSEEELVGLLNVLLEYVLK